MQKPKLLPAKSKISSHKPIKVLVTAGPTRAFIDPVRYISNLSTGKMGYEIASQAVQRKYKVTLISGPTYLKPLRSARMIFIETVDELEKAVMKEVRSADILIMTAAVNDYVPVHVNKKKLRRKKGAMTLKLRRTNDIVARAARLSQKTIIVGFSLETERLAAHTYAKLKKKKLDLIVGNEYSKYKNPFGENKSSVLIINRQGKSRRLPVKSKKEIAKSVLSEAIALFEQLPLTA